MDFVSYHSFSRFFLKSLLRHQRHEKYPLGSITNQARRYALRPSVYKHWYQIKMAKDLKKRSKMRKYLSLLRWEILSSFHRLSNFLKRAIPGLFPLIFVFSMQISIELVVNKICRWQDLNCQHLVYQLSYNHCSVLQHFQVPFHFFPSQILHLCFWHLQKLS